ncbi:hypothetical protein QYF36_019870 [Acer negundo]|nr:hypothetical protein QYF36_019870 [Acer negundo]
MKNPTWCWKAGSGVRGEQLELSVFSSFYSRCFSDDDSRCQHGYRDLSRTGRPLTDTGILLKLYPSIGCH